MTTLIRKTSPSFTRDDAAAIEAARTRFFAAASLGEKQAVTPEGFLICYDVPAARTGIMWYAEGEVPIRAIEGRVQVIRDESEVFRPEFVASFAGKPVVNDHPPVEVRPENWKTYAVGTVFNPRRGSGMMAEMLLVDLVIYDPVAISDIRSGKREVSCGYDAEYEETAPGQGRQYNMVGNHIALVESGRCGSRCSIGDRKPEEGDDAMRTLDHRTVDDAGQGKRTAVRDWFKSFTDGLREAMKKGGDALDKYLSDATNSPEKLITADEGGQGPGTGELHLHLPGQGGGDRRMTDEDIEKRFKEMGDALSAISAHVGYKPGGGEENKNKGAGAEDAEAAKLAETKKVEGALKEEAPAGTTDAAIAAGTKDSALLEDAYRETVSLAEILVPGARPTKTFDRAATAQATLDALCGFRRTVLDLAYHQAEGRAMIDQLTGGKPFDPKAGSCAEVKTMFRSAANMRKTANDAMLRARQQEERGGASAKTAPRSAAELNELHRKHYDKK